MSPQTSAVSGICQQSQRHAVFSTLTSRRIPGSFFVYLILSISTACAAPHAPVLAAAKACEPEARALLQQLVQIDSGTGDAPGLAAIGAILKPKLEESGAKVESAP